MAFDAIFLTLFFLTWVILGALPWIAWSAHRHAHGALWALPFAWLGGAAGGVIVPALGLDNDVGIGVSMITALLGGLLFTGTAYWVWDTSDLGRFFDRLAVQQPAIPQPSHATNIDLIASTYRPPHTHSGDDAGEPTDAPSPSPLPHPPIHSEKLAAQKTGKPESPDHPADPPPPA